MCIIDNWDSQLTALEQNSYLELFKKVDADGKGIVLQDEALPFFKTSNVPDNILTEVSILVALFVVMILICCDSFGMPQIVRKKDS